MVTPDNFAEHALAIVAPGIGKFRTVKRACLRYVLPCNIKCLGKHTARSMHMDVYEYGCIFATR
jgi:hypothetical protein